jgi:hypothetical protein
MSLQNKGAQIAASYFSNQGRSNSAKRLDSLTPDFEVTAPSLGQRNTGPKNTIF